jgi:hypothetical protein
MAKSKWIFKEIKARQGTGPSWLIPKKGERHVYYVMRYGSDLNEAEVYVFRNGYFSLPHHVAPDNPELEHMALAGTPEELTGHYIDFLIENSDKRFQTVRSLFQEVLEGKDPRKRAKKRKTTFKYKRQ